MAIKKFEIETSEDMELGDRVISFHAGADGRAWLVEREVPDEVSYKPGDTGTATIENSYGVAQPDQAGVWVRRGSEILYALFEVKPGRRAVWPESKVSHFAPSPGVSEVVATLTNDLNHARAEKNKVQRQLGRVEEALSALVLDLQRMRFNVDTGRPTASMVTSAGATMQRWLEKRNNDKKEK